MKRCNRSSKTQASNSTRLRRITLVSARASAFCPIAATRAYIYLWDQLRLGSRPERLNVLELICVQLFDGKHSLREVQAEAMRRVGGTFLPLDWFTNLVKRLDEAFFLDSPRFQARCRARCASRPAWARTSRTPNASTPDLGTLQQTTRPRLATGKEARRGAARRPYPSH